MSQANTSEAPISATAGRLARSLSPIKRLTILGTTSPINGMLPTVTTTSEVISDTIISPADEADILERVASGAFERRIKHPPISIRDVMWLQEAVNAVYVAPVIRQYIVALVGTTRGSGPRPVAGIERHVRVGASPRGAIALMKVAQSIALQDGRGYVTPDDVRLLRHPVLRHRLVLTYDALADDVAPESIIDAVFQAVPTP